MVKKATAQSRGRGASAASERLTRIRQRHNERLQRQREQERRIAAACKPFAQAVAAVDEVERQYATTLEDLERRQEAARAERDRRIGEQRQKMAATVLEIQQAGLPAKDTAELLELSVSQMRELVRETTADRGGAATTSRTTDAPEQPAAPQATATGRNAGDRPAAWPVSDVENIAAESSPGVRVDTRGDGAVGPA